MNLKEIEYEAKQMITELYQNGLELQDQLSVATHLLANIYAESNVTKENFIIMCGEVAKMGEWKRRSQKDE